MRHSRDGGDCDRERVIALLHRESASILAYFARRLDVVEDAADLLNETLIVGWRKREEVPRAEDEARMWLFGVARRVLGTHRRGRLRRAALLERARAELVVASEHIHTDDDLGRVRALVARLGERDREIFMLVHWDGFSLAEVARLQRVNPATVRSRYNRALQRLRADLSGRGATKVVSTGQQIQGER
jgi:RNA polymerase sigma-70 factor, ECF subfamily